MNNGYAKEGGYSEYNDIAGAEYDEEYHYNHAQAYEYNEDKHRLDDFVADGEYKQQQEGAAASYEYDPYQNPRDNQAYAEENVIQEDYPPEELSAAEEAATAAPAPSFPQHLGKRKSTISNEYVRTWL